MLTISALSTEYVKVPVAATVNGASHDPTGDVVQLAFTVVGSAPGASDWKTGSWETAGTVFYARCLVGPTGTVQLTAGRDYSVWVKVTDSPEVPVLLAGQVEVV